MHRNSLLRRLQQHYALPVPVAPSALCKQAVVKRQALMHNCMRIAILQAARTEAAVHVPAGSNSSFTFGGTPAGASTTPSFGATGGERL